MLLPTIFLLLAVLLQADLSSGSGMTPEAKKEILDKHNNLRGNVNPTARNMLKMVWDETIAANAQKRANLCQFTTSTLEQRTVNGIVCGENIFMASYQSSWSNAINAWHNGVSNFKYGVGAIDPKKGIAGYTQIVWYKSYRIGCAFASCPEKTMSYFYVCQYCPAGNIVGQMATPYKKGPSCGDCSNNCENNLCTNPCPYTDVITNCQEMRKLVGCEEKIMNEKCAAFCNCKTEIK